MRIVLQTIGRGWSRERYSPALGSFTNRKYPYKEAVLARNQYTFEKRRREIEKKRKKEEKSQRKLDKQEPSPGEQAEAPVAEAETGPSPQQ